MASVKSVQAIRREEGRIYISGYASGLEEGWNYCFYYRYMGGPIESLGNAHNNYTFIKLDDLSRATNNTRKYEFGTNGAYVGDEGEGVYDILIYLVGRSCDEKLHLESTKSFAVETTETPTPGETPYTPPTPPTPGGTPIYLTPEQAAARLATGLPCYIKCTLPILSMLPGIPYTPGTWVPPFCAISSAP